MHPEKAEQNGRSRNGDVTLPAVDEKPDAVTVETLLEKMRDGDREAAALFVFRYGPRIRRRIRGKLGPAMRRIFDSQDIMSSVGRRLDAFIRGRKLTAKNEEELWGLVHRIASRVLIDKARVFYHVQETEGEDSDFAYMLAGRLREAERSSTAGTGIELERVFELVGDQTDGTILFHWLQGKSYGTIGKIVNLTPANVRKRWERLKVRLRERWAKENCA